MVEPTEVVEQVQTDAAATVAAAVVETVQTDDAVIIDRVEATAAETAETQEEILEGVECGNDQQIQILDRLSSLQMAVTELRESSIALREAQLQTQEQITQLNLRLSTVILPSNPPQPEPEIIVETPPSDADDRPAVEENRPPVKRLRKI
jgi:TolA-binding protein